MMARAGPGKRLPEGMNPLLILRDGVPVVGSASIGAGLHQETLQCMVNVLDYSMDPKTALDRPSFMAPEWTPSGFVEQVAARDFPTDVPEAVKALGQPVQELPSGELKLQLAKGTWVVILIDPQTDTLEGGAPRTFGGYAAGY
jgi:gamma-glutamyltranspeptidase/glutathione hydrolase